MKASNKNEIDVLLRALGRGAGDARAIPPSSNIEMGAHLDADELNCYAEGVVSDLERARYNQHLADCDSCRSIVVGLVPAAGVIRSREALDQKSSRNWRATLAAWFAPSVLRYAVPALALTTIMAIAFVVLRRPQQTEFVAQNQTQPAQGVHDSAADKQAATTTNTVPSVSSSPLNAVSPTNQAPASSTEAREKKNSNDKEKAAPLEAPVLAQNSPTSADRTYGFIAPSKSAGVASPKVFSPEPAAAAPPPPRPDTDAAKLAEARQEEADEELQKRGREDREDRKAQPRDENEVARTGPAKGGPSRNNSQNVAGLSSVMSGSANKDERGAGNAETRRSAETRRVSGRVFNRRGNAWIDTDYASGRATVSVSRNSEQYRSLIADEPGLRSIAEQLGGEVIVVWKGTAYRFH